MSWLWRGAQSAFFYYVSCAPCTNFAYQRKRRKAQNKARKEEAEMQGAPPEGEHHPLPFSTNIYWQEEITVGPGPPPKKKEKVKSDSVRRLNTGLSRTSGISGSSAGSTLVLSTNSKEGLSEDHDPDAFSLKRYQRPDEPLWGRGDDTSKKSSLGLSDLVRSSSRGSGHCYTARYPAVNDLHPPVVSSFQSHEIRWMLQPPPPAKFMEGKNSDGTRSRSVSGASHGSSLNPAPARARSKGTASSTTLKPPSKDSRETLRGRSNVSGDGTRESISPSKRRPSPLDFSNKRLLASFETVSSEALKGADSRLLCAGDDSIPDDRRKHARPGDVPDAHSTTEPKNPSLLVIERNTSLLKTGHSGRNRDGANIGVPRPAARRRSHVDLDGDDTLSEEDEFNLDRRREQRMPVRWSMDL